MLKRTILFQTVVFILSLIFYTKGYAGLVKMSTSQMCHPESSPYYSRIKNYTSFPNLLACLDAGGRLPTGVEPPTIPETNSSSAKEYKREYFGNGWADLDHDCQNSRMEALIEQSTGPVHFATDKKCRVVSGRWISPYTNAIIHDASKIDIDHIVPLKWAWDHGADLWVQGKREQFANDPSNLFSVEASLNRQKGALGPDEWLPPDNQCEYILRFLRIVKKYKLQEPQALSDVRQDVCK